MKQVAKIFFSFPVAVLLTQTFVCPNSDATTISWTNTAGGNWSVAANWSPNFVPGQLNALSSTDDVLITNAGTYTVVLDEGTSPNFWDIRSLTLGAGGGHGVQTLAMTNKILYVNPLTVTNGGVLADIHSSFHAAIAIASGGQLNSTNGTYFVNPLVIAGGGTFTTKGTTIIEGDGPLEMEGTLNVSNGVLTLDDPVTNSGTMTVSSGAGVSIDAPLVLAGPVTNAGTMTVVGSGAISIYNDHSSQLGGIVNLAGGEINLNNANGILGDNNQAYLVNQGTVNSTGGGYIQSVPGFTNSGAINVSASTLNLDSGLHLESSGSLNAQLNSAGSYGKIAISGNVALAGAFNVTLGNGYNPQNGDSFQPVTYSSHSDNFTATNLPTLVPWQFNYGSSAVVLAVTTRTIIWTNTLGGNWSNPNNWSPNLVPGGTTYGNDDDVQITAPGNYTVVMDEGLVSSPYYVHSLTLGAGGGVQTLAITGKWLDAASMTVNAGGQVNSSGNHWFNNWVTPLLVANGGVFNSANDLFDQYVTVSSGGVFTTADSTNGNGWFAVAGSLNVSAGVLTLNGATTNSGTMTVSNGASISVNDTLVLSGTGGIMNLPGGAIDLAGGHGISGDNGAEYLANQGAINSSSGYIQSVPGFTNSGAINALTDTLTLDSGLQLQPAGSLNTQLNSAGDYGKIVINGNAALNGTFGVILNYVPAAGDSFTPLTYDSDSGNVTMNLPVLGTGQSWQSTLGATALTLQVAETVIWTNTAGGNWSAAANWNPNKVPGQFDDVGITTPGTYTVNEDVAAANVKSLTLGTGGGIKGTNTLSVVSKTFYVDPLTINGGGVLTNYNSTFHAVITVENGGQVNSVNGSYYANPLLIADGGTLNANGDTFHLATMVAAGGVFTTPGATIASDGSLTVNGTLNVLSQTLTMYGPMTNSGIVNIDSNSGIYIYNNGTPSYLGSLLNLAGGTINLIGFNGIQGSFGQDYFVNEGVVVSTGNGAKISVSRFDNSAGVVTNLSAGYLYVGAFTNTLTGVYYTTNGSIIQFTGGAANTPLTPGNPLVLAGAGQYRFASGWLELPTDIVPNLQLTGGQLELGATFQDGAITNLTLDGITFTNINNLPVTGIFAVTNSVVYDDLTVQNNGQLIANDATFHGDIMVAAGGVFNTPGATIASDGSLTVNGTLNVLTQTLTMYGPMTNSGIVNIDSNSGIYIYNNGTAAYQGSLLNLPDGTINLIGFNGIQGSLGQDYFVNEGVVVSTGNGAKISMSRFDNSTGVVTNLSAGYLYVGTFTNTLVGVYYATNGSIIQFTGGAANAPLAPGSPLVLAGAGQYRFASGWLELPADIIPGLQLTGGQLKLDAGFQGGAITNLALDGITLTNINNLPVTGTFATTNSAVYGSYLVDSGGVWNANGNNIYSTVSIAAGGIFNDCGTVQIFLPGSMSVAANGQVNLITGYLYLYAPLTNSGAITLNANNYIYIFNNGTSYLGGVLNQPDGVLNLLSSGGIGTTSYGREYLINNGIIIKSSYTGNTPINVSDFTNSGAIISQKGTLQLNQITLLPSGSLGVSLNSPTDYGKLSISGATALAGAFNATLGGIYVPVYGTSFNVLSYGSYSGNFGSYNLPAVVTWQPEYGSTIFTLLVEQPQFALALAGTNLVFNANGGTYGNQGIVLASPDLTLPLASWTPLVTNPFDVNGHFSFTNAIDPGQPQRFYILKFP